MTPEERARRAIEAAGRAADPALLAAVAAAIADVERAVPDRPPPLEGSRAVAAVTADEALQRLILDTVPGGVVVVEPSGAVVTANAEALRFLGLQWDVVGRRYVQDWDGETLREDGSPFPAEDYPVVRCLRTGVAQPRAVVGVRPPGGDVRWGLFSAVPVPDPAGGAPLGAVVTFVDITERRRVEEALRRSEERFRLLVEASPDHLCIVDEAGVIEFMNRTGGAYALADVVGRPAVDFLAPEHRPALAAALRRAFEEGATTTFEVRVHSDRWYREYVAPLHGDDGRVRRAMVVASDVTERRRSEAERRALDDRIREAQHLQSMALLAGGIAHDFGNLLVGVRGRVDLALERVRGTALEEALGPLLLDARAAALQAGELTRQLVAYSGRGAIVRGPVDLGELVEETAQLLRGTICPRAVVRLELARDLPPAQADATQVRQILMNLLTNAAEAEARAIAVRTRAVAPAEARGRATFTSPDPDAAAWVEVEVVDDGCGMSPETKARVFDPFFTTKFVGRGLGLAAVLGIVRGHGGGIGVVSTPGVGSTFRVLLPAAGAPSTPRATERPPGPAAPAAARGRAVLVVDDEHHVRAVARLALEGSGLRVLLAEGGQQGVELLARHRDEVGVVLLDLLMPDMNGFETLDALRRVRADVQVILSSGYGDDAPPERLRQLAGVLRKPWAVDELVEAVQRALPR